MTNNNTKNLEGVRVEEVKYTETSRGVAIDATLYLDDVKIGYVEHKGDGGPASIWVEPGDSRDELQVRMDESANDDEAPKYYTSVQ